MVKSDVFWQLFARTGHVGAYILYKEYDLLEKSSVEEVAESSSIRVQEANFGEKGIPF